MSKNCPDCGRRMDLSWRQCPYCTREQQAGKSKDLDWISPTGEESMTDNKPRQATRVGRDAPRSGARRTEHYPGSVERRPDPERAADNRRIVGVLVSYTWEQGGRVFEVREGRTHIGAGEIKGEDRLTDVSCPQDDMLSDDHAMILVQGGQDGEFYISDLSSMNGTVLNGKRLRPEIPEPLPSPAEIKVGETVFTFVRLAGARGTAISEPPKGEPPRRPPTEIR
jgi:FHA domain